MASKDIYSKLIKDKCSHNNKSKNYWKIKLQLENITWDSVFCKAFGNKLVPRKISDFNWRVFYGIVPVENRLKAMRKSDGICKLCNEELENMEHMLFTCIKLENLWEKTSALVNKIFGTVLTITYRDVILGLEPSSNIEPSDVINMSIFCCKWIIWLRRNTFVFENILQDSNWLWRNFQHVLNEHVLTIVRSKVVKKKEKGTMDALLVLKDNVL